MEFLWIFLATCAISFACGIPVLIVMIRDVREKAEKPKPRIVRCYKFRWR